MRLLRAAAFGACALGDLPPALDRRRIAAPRLRTRHHGKITLAHWSMGRHNLSKGRSACEAPGCDLRHWPRLRSYRISGSEGRFALRGVVTAFKKRNDVCSVQVVTMPSSESRS